MPRKELLLSLTLLFSFLFIYYIFSVYASPAAASIVFIKPVDTNATEVFTTQPIVNVTTNMTTANMTCNFTATKGADAWKAMNNNTVNFWNASAITWTANARAIRNTTVRCNDTIGAGELSNETIYFYINERTANSTILVEAGITNGSIVGERPNLFVNLNATLSYCEAWIFSPNSDILNIAMSNLTNRTTYTNSSVIELINETWYGDAGPNWNNITYKCWDAWGNVSWMNTSIGEGSALGFTKFKYDNRTPSVDWSTAPFTNATFNNNTVTTWLNITFNVTDRNIDKCRVRAEVENGTALWFNGVGTAATISDGFRHMNCSFLLYPENLTGGLVDGDLNISHWANDTAGNSAYSSSNESALFTTLPAGKWTPVTFTDANASTKTLADTLPTVTSIAWWNNDKAQKNYTTFAISTPTLNDKVLSFGDGIQIYSSTLAYYLRKNYIVTGTSNVSVYEGLGNCISTATCFGATANKTAWNFIGTQLDRTMNETLYMCHLNDTASAKWYSKSKACAKDTGDSINITTEMGKYNITYASFYNATSGNYITCKYGWELCTGCSVDYPWNCTVTGINLKKSNALWINIGANMTINRKRY